MKPYLLFMCDLSTVPLQGQNLRGAKIENFDDFAVAQSVAEKEKRNWDLLLVYKRMKEGELEKIEQYQNGRRYEVQRK